MATNDKKIYSYLFADWYNSYIRMLTFKTLQTPEAAALCLPVPQAKYR